MKHRLNCRPCKFCNGPFYSDESAKTGLFHTWGTTTHFGRGGDGKVILRTCGICEAEDGVVHVVEPRGIRFTNTNYKNGYYEYPPEAE